MTDRLSPERRSWLMSRVRGRDTSPELKVRKIAHGLGLRFRLRRDALPGKPDIVFPSRSLALFVHGCFWHRHKGCRKATTPKTNVEFWNQKFRSNVARDKRVVEKLRDLGWRTAVIWQCETVDPQSLKSILRKRVVRLSLRSSPRPRAR